jgi:serine/threonine protein kinase
LKNRAKNLISGEVYWYIVQQFVEGQTLYQELEQQGIWTEAEIRKLLQELLEVLKFIHQNRTIHRDLKPANIMRRRSDRKLVLIDVGIAKELAETTLNPKLKNAIGTIIGSFGYASLEQMQGGRVYPASDLYSLGATCFHLLSGIHPVKLFLLMGKLLSVVAMTKPSKFGDLSSWKNYK